ncbi:YihY/virulence factor BrkB family protein [Sphingomonas crocodyli]|uniref:YihY/virulence factor BrkB family protein n=1 Tax=Sphingomonas crocodyli TaxID=1979270 RepID=A0A437LY58_9SPHN|nr:YihY/virulence factor BrkB family protein [Sphingomonas crocodyli]RVT90358.1 YihY/virulence factor BrkB family protein [Sphingomonas crocodyli]
MVFEEADQRGRYADSPWAIPLKGWIEVLKRTWSEATEDSIGLVAAGVAFYGFLAIAPLLAATILVYGLVAEPADVGSDLRAMLTVMPPDAVRLIDDLLVAAVHTSEGKAGFGLLVALAIALYGGMNGANALITALNIAYEEQDRRGFVRVNLLALGLTAAGVAGLVVALGLAAMISHLRATLPEAGPALVIAGRIASVLAGGLVCAAAAATLYRYGPDRRDAKWVWLSPGSIAAAALWVAISLGFGVYAARFANYGATYGSASAIIVMLTWLYLSAYILLLGAELNSELEHQTVRDTTRGAPKPLGERGAVVADTVAGMPGGAAQEVNEFEGDKATPAAT